MSSGFAHDLAAEQLQALRQGSRVALAAVYDRFAGPVYGLALRALGNRPDAEDLVQTIFIKLPRASRRFRGDAPFGLWLRKLAANATIDFLRDRRRLLRLEDARAELADEVHPTLAIEAQALLDRLSPSARLVLLLHAVEGYTHAEMAELFGQSPSYSKSILSRALGRVRSAMNAEVQSSHDDEKLSRPE